jgi:hypothetical protein
VVRDRELAAVRRSAISATPILSPVIRIRSAR